jgi:hypothetical protein
MERKMDELATNQSRLMNFPKAKKFDAFGHHRAKSIAWKKSEAAATRNGMDFFQAERWMCVGNNNYFQMNRIEPLRLINEDNNRSNSWKIPRINTNRTQNLAEIFIDELRIGTIHRISCAMDQTGQKEREIWTIKEHKLLTIMENLPVVIVEAAIQKIKRSAILEIAS